MVPVNPATVPDEPPGAWADWAAVMDTALVQAAQAAQVGEVPVGAVLLSAEGEVLAQAHNAPISGNDPTAHAEIRCLRAAAKGVNNYRLPGTILAVTLEPCLMCLGALVHARVAGVVYGTPDPKTGALVSRLDGINLEFLNHRMWVLSGVREDACAKLLRDFFRARR